MNKKFFLSMILFFSAFLSPLNIKAAAPTVEVSYAIEHGYFYDAASDHGGEVGRAEWAFMLDEWMNHLQPSFTAIGYVPESREVLLNDIAGSVFYDSIYSIASKGIVEEGLLAYRPDAPLVRQQFCEFMTVLLKQIGIGPDYALDVDAIALDYKDWGAILPLYEDDVAFMIYTGLVNSVGDGYFAPDGSITRAQVCSVLLKAETLVREKERSLYAESFGADSQMYIARVNGSNITADGFNFEVTVNDSAKELNPHVVIGYTQDPDETPTADNILSGRFLTQSQRLTEMRRVNTAPDETTYSVRFNGKPNTTYYMFALLKNGSEYSNLANFKVTMPGV